MERTSSDGGDGPAVELRTKRQRVETSEEEEEEEEEDNSDLPTHGYKGMAVQTADGVFVGASQEKVAQTRERLQWLEALHARAKRAVFAGGMPNVMLFEREGCQFTSASTSEACTAISCAAVLAHLTRDREGATPSTVKEFSSSTAPQDRECPLHARQNRASAAVACAAAACPWGRVTPERFKRLFEKGPPDLPWRRITTFGASVMSEWRSSGLPRSETHCPHAMNIMDQLPLVANTARRCAIRLHSEFGGLIGDVDGEDDDDNDDDDDKADPEGLAAFNITLRKALASCFNLALEGAESLPLDGTYTEFAAVATSSNITVSVMFAVEPRRGVTVYVYDSHGGPSMASEQEGTNPFSPGAASAEGAPLRSYLWRLTNAAAAAGCLSLAFKEPGPHAEYSMSLYCRTHHLPADSLRDAVKAFYC